MTTVILPNQVDQGHLAKVRAEMSERGAPTIRGMWLEEGALFYAFEGSHRVIAASALGIESELVALDADDMLTAEEIGWDDMGWFDGEPARAIDILDRMREAEFSPVMVEV